MQRDRVHSPRLLSSIPAVMALGTHAVASIVAAPRTALRSVQHAVPRTAKAGWVGVHLGLPDHSKCLYSSWHSPTPW